MKKLLLALGSISAIVVPTVTVISCGTTTPTKTNPIVSVSIDPTEVHQDKALSPLKVLSGISYTEDSNHNYETIIKSLTAFIGWKDDEHIVGIEDRDTDHTAFIFTEGKIVSGVNVDVSHLVTMNTITGKIVSIKDSKGKVIDQNQVDEVNGFDDGFEINDGSTGISTRKVTFSEAAIGMAKLLDDLGKARGVTCSRDEFLAKSVTGASIYDVDLAAIIDIPPYINLLVDKAAGSRTLKYRISFTSGIQGMSDISVQF